MNNGENVFGGSVPSEGTRAVSVAASKHPYRLGRAFSLGDNRQFTYVYRRGKSYPARHMVLIYLRARALRVGFSVSAKVGGSVVRSRVKRRMSEDFRMLRPYLKSGKYVFVARPPAAQAEWQTMQREMRSLLLRAGLLTEEASK